MWWRQPKNKTRGNLIGDCFLLGALFARKGLSSAGIHGIRWHRLADDADVILFSFLTINRAARVLGGNATHSSDDAGWRVALSSVRDGHEHRNVPPLNVSSKTVPLGVLFGSEFISLERNSFCLIRRRRHTAIALNPSKRKKKDRIRGFFGIFLQIIFSLSLCYSGLWGES